MPVEAKQKRPPTVKKFFIDRMKREGREQEWYSTVKQVQAETGKGYGQASYDAMKRMGYQGPKQERQLQEEYLANLHKTSAQVETEKIQEEIREERKALNFEDAVRTLPDKCPISEEIDWIRAHPAMSRRARQKDKVKDVLVTADDILCAPHGKAPSKATVYALQHWANSPSEFYKQLLSEQKKITEESNDRTKAASDVGLAEVERLLKEIKREAGLDKD